MSASGFLLRADLRDPERHAVGGFDICVYSRPAPGNELNEDGAWFAEVEDGVVAAIADGAGGVRRGGEAAEAALRAMAEAVGDRKRPLRDRILSGFEDANRRVQELVSGTTMCVVECSAGAVRFYNVGDSAALLTGQRGKLKDLTVSHSPVGYALEAGVITEDEALEHDDRHLVSNLLGSADMRIDMGVPRRIAARDTIVLGSDGLFDNLSSAEIVDIIKSGGLYEGAEKLARSCSARMSGEWEGPSKPDDLTFFVMRARQTAQAD